jgi:hypothetical protein
MDESESPEVSFVTQPDLAEAIDREISVFFQERGR